MSIRKWFGCSLYILLKRIFGQDIVSGKFEGAITLTSLCCFSVFFFQLAAEYSECTSGKKVGDFRWFPRGKMAGPFQDVAFSTPVGATSAPFKSTHGYHIILSEGRKN
ncbi:hypothetical protein ACSBR1_042425 [Camellia fascicularis]